MHRRVETRPARLDTMFHFFDAQFARLWVGDFARRLRQRAPQLSRLDAAIGDGDHGDNMRDGAGDVMANLRRRTVDTVESTLGLAGDTMAAAAGATAPLYGTFFLRLGAFAARSVTLDAAALALGLRMARDAVQAAGRAVPGEKTLCDALSPAVEAMDAAVYGGLSLVESLEHSAVAAENGRDATHRMVARQGRASQLPEGGLGHVDPGAASMALLFRAAADVAAADCRDHT